MEVYVLVIKTRTVSVVASAHETELGANLALANYVKVWWEDEMDDKPMPDDAGQMITQYMEAAEESYTVEECEVLDDDASQMLYRSG